MSGNTELAKIIEFIHRTQMVDKMKEHKGWNSEVMLGFLLMLPVRYNWDVDAAVQGFSEGMEPWGISTKIKDFEPKTFLAEHFAAMNEEVPSLQQFNKLFFGFEIEEDLNEADVQFRQP